MIYDSISATLRDARAYASSQAQLRMLDRVAHMLGDELGQYNRFQKEIFLEQAQAGYGVYIDNTLEKR